MADPDILTAIEIIDRKIQSLQEARNNLAQAFGIQLAPTSPTIQTAIPLPRQGAVGQKSRKVALAEFLIARGPMSRADIVAYSGVPEGTISYCLNDKKFFVQLENGQWQVTDHFKRGPHDEAQVEDRALMTQ